MKTYEDFKNEISLVDLVEYYGYRLQKGQGIKIPIYENANKDKIGIFNPGQTGKERYFNCRNNYEKGSCIDFIQNRLKDGTIPMPLMEANVAKATTILLSNFNGCPLETRERNKQLFIRQEETKIPNKNFEETKCMLTNTQFLHARGFSDSTIMSKLFTDRIFNIKDKRFRYNIAFPIWNKDEKIVGMESRNDGFKGFLPNSDRSSAIWHSNVPEKIEGVFVAETPLDCIAHYQLHKNDNILYCSFGGTLSPDQVNVVNDLLRKNISKIDAKNFKFMLGADNDVAGARYDMMFINAQLTIKKLGYIDQVSSGDVKKFQFDVEIPNVESNKFPKKAGETIETDGMEVSKTGDNTYSFKIAFGDYIAMKEFNKTILDLHKLPHTVFEKAVMKDWNDDLMVLRKINKNKKEKISYNVFSENRELFFKDCNIFENQRKEKEMKRVIKRLGI